MINEYNKAIVDSAFIYSQLIMRAEVDYTLPICISSNNSSDHTQ